MKPIILCIDDEKMVLTNLKQQLKSSLGNDYKYESAESAEEAFEIIEEVDAPIILVITDWLMPGIKGDEFLVQFKKKYPNTIPIMLSGQADEEAVKRAYEEAGLFAFIKKPWNKEELMDTIQKAIQKVDLQN